MTGWSVMLRGIRYRSGRSLVVLLLSAFAIVACVLAPAYGRAAAQSVLTDAMRSAPQTAAALTVSAESSAAGALGGAFDPAQQSVAEAKLFVDGALAKAPQVAAIVDRPVTAMETDVRLGDHAVLLAWRLGACAQLRIVAGECAIDIEQVVISERSAADAGLKVGDEITPQPDRAGASGKPLKVVGLYTPEDSSDIYWGSSAYFSFAPGQRLDAMFAGSEDDVRLPGATITATITYPLLPEAVRLDAMPGLRSDLGSLGLALNSAELRLETALLSIADDVAKDQAALAGSVPLIAVPLLLLAFVVLFLIVTALTEERAAELALARLRGFPAVRAARFGLGETLLLIALGAPLGLIAGLAFVELAARTTLAEGTHVELRWPVFAAAAAGFAVALVAAWLATRQTFGRGVLTLLRKVPQRATAKAWVVEAVVGTLAVAGLLASLQDQMSTVRLLAPAAFALLAGLIAGRLLRLWAGFRLAMARRRGNLTGILAAAQLARKPGAARVTIVLTTAIALLSFAAAAWDVAARARHERAQDLLGAAGVYQVMAAHPQALIDAVAAADPTGGSMAVVRSSEQYGQGRVELIGVQSDLIESVVKWRDRDGSELSRLGEQLRTGSGRPATLNGDVAVRTNVSGLGDVPLRLGAVISAPGRAPGIQWLGNLTPGTKDYSSTLPACTGCRFAGLVVGRIGTLTGSIRAALAVEEIRSGTAPLAVAEAGRWRTAADRNPTARVQVRPEGNGVTFGVESSGPGDVTVSYLDSVAVLPAVLAGAAPQGADADSFTFPGFANAQQQFNVVERTDMLPRAGTHGLLFDLDLAVRSASTVAGLADATDLHYEVWTNGASGAALGSRLSEQGLRVLRYSSEASELEQLGRRAPALGFGLYLLAGVAAAALALGVLLLNGRLGAGERRAELAALRAAGVRERVLKRALRRERLTSLALPIVIGLAAGLGAAALMLPGIPLVTADVVQPAAQSWRFWVPTVDIAALPLAIAAALLALISGLLTAGRPAQGGVQ